jgi:hypothetical protein
VWARAAAEADGVLQSRVSERRFLCSSSSSSSLATWTRSAPRAAGTTSYLLDSSTASVTEPCF